MDTVPLHDFLGWVAEHNSDLLFSLAGMETRSLRDRLKDTQIRRPVYVCGLARSGTTILLELISRHSETATYRYMDFPLVMIPFWWSRFLRLYRKRSEAVERSHGDRIEVTPESPEAMEEILWMKFFPDLHNPAMDNTLTAEDTGSDFDDFYRNTIRKLLLSRGRGRYLAKNNYNVARLGYLKRLFGEVSFVIPVRDPVWHIASLMKQHRLLKQEERKDRKVLSYMRRVGHFEFGLDLRPINTGPGSRTGEIMHLWESGNEVEGWAKYWADIHNYIYRELTARPELAESAMVVSYRKLCEDSERVLGGVYSHARLDVDDKTIEEQGAGLTPPSYYDPDFTQEQMDIIGRETSGIFRKILSLSI
ncbi:MAG: sulfotransferase [Candidatus Krumholzibacteriota bacterium]